MIKTTTHDVIKEYNICEEKIAEIKLKYNLSNVEMKELRKYIDDKILTTSFSRRDILDYLLFNYKALF